MANASAKKADAARSKTSATYLPIFIIVNVIYGIIRVLLRWSTFTRYQIAAAALLWMLTVVSYQGILDDAAQKAANSKGSDLVGGAYLDLWGLVVVVQFGSLLISERFLWLLAVLPVWAGWKLYTTFFGGSGGIGGMFGGSGSGGSGDKDGSTEGAGAENASASADKKRRRAEKRRQKWS